MKTTKPKLAHRMNTRVGDEERSIADRLLAAKVAENESELLRRGLRCLGAAHGVTL